MGMRSVSRRREKEIEARYGSQSARSLVGLWDIADPRVNAARDQHFVTDNTDTYFFGHRIRRLPGEGPGIVSSIRRAGSSFRSFVRSFGTNMFVESMLSLVPHSQSELLSKITKQHAGTLSRKVREKVDAANKKSDGSFDLKAVEAYAVGKNLLVMKEEKGVDLLLFHLAVKERAEGDRIRIRPNGSESSVYMDWGAQLESMREARERQSGHGNEVGEYLRSFGVSPNVSDKMLDRWAKVGTQKLAETLRELERCSINPADVMITGVKNDRLQLTHVMDENRMDYYQPLSEALVRKMKSAFKWAKRRYGSGDESGIHGHFASLENIDIRGGDYSPENSVDTMESGGRVRTLQVSRQHPIEPVAIKRVGERTAGELVDAFQEAVRKYNEVPSTRGIRMLEPSAIALDDEYVLMSRTVGIDMQTLCETDTPLAKNLRMRMDRQGIDVNSESVSRWKRHLRENFKVSIGGMEYTPDFDKLLYAHDTGGNIYVVPTIYDPRGRQ